MRALKLLPGSQERKLNIERLQIMSNQFPISIHSTFALRKLNQFLGEETQIQCPIFYTFFQHCQP